MPHGSPSQSRPNRAIAHLLQPFVSESPKLDEEDAVNERIAFSLGAIALGVLSIIGLALQTACLVGDIKEERSRRSVNIVLETLWTFTTIISALSRPRTASSILAVVLIVLLFTQILFAFSIWADQSSGSPMSWNVLLLTLGSLNAFFATAISLSMPIRDPRFSTETISQPFTTPTSKLRSPEDNLTLWQWMSVSWMAPMIDVGSKRQLNGEDVWTLPFEFQHRQLHDSFRQLRGTVFRRLIRANFVDLIILSLLALLELAANYSAPLLLQRLLTAMERLNARKESAIFWAALIMAARLVAAQSAVFSMWFGRRCYERSRGEMITMLYEKTLNRKIMSGVTDEKEQVEPGIEADLQNSDVGCADSDALVNGDAGDLSGS